MMWFVLQYAHRLPILRQVPYMLQDSIYRRSYRHGQAKSRPQSLTGSAVLVKRKQGCRAVRTPHLCLSIAANQPGDAYDKESRKKPAEENL